MKFLLRLYRVVNQLSLDVACGAMVCAAFFGHILHVQIQSYALGLLGLTVWIIYTTDHLLDVRRLKQEAFSQRYRFYQQNFRKLCIASVISILIAIGLILLVQSPVVNWGLVLAVVVAVYLVVQQKLGLVKELVISILYTAGILLPSMSMTRMDLSGNEYVLILILILSFAQTAFINLVLFSWYDWKQDLSDSQSSLVTFMGRSRAKKILAISFLIQVIFFSTLILFSTFRMETLVLVVMNAVLFLLYLFPTKFSANGYYRLIGDIVFLFPLPYLLLLK